MGTKDGAAFIEEQLGSLLAQSHSPVDLWISDDGSIEAVSAYFP